MMCLGAIVYALNYCSISLTDENVEECHQLIEAAKSYGACEEFSETIALLEALPTNAISAHIAKREKKAKITQEAKGSCEDIRKLVGAMSNLDSFRSIIVSLATSSKSEEASNSVPAVCRCIGDELKKFNWSQLDFDMSDIKNLNAIKPLFSAVSDDFAKLAPEVGICPS